MTLTTTALTTLSIEHGYDDDRWLGWGYLGGRQDLTDEDRRRADLTVIDYANEHGWDYDRLFEWLNSRPGRHYADDPFHPQAWRCLAADLSA